MIAQSSTWAVRARSVGARRQLAAFLLAAPLTVLLALRINHFVRDPLFSSYGAIVLGTTAVVIYLAFRHYHDPSLDPPVESTPPPVSCLVAVKNEQDVIERC